MGMKHITGCSGLETCLVWSRCSVDGWVLHRPPTACRNSCPHLRSLPRTRPCALMLSNAPCISATVLSAHGFLRLVTPQMDTCCPCFFFFFIFIYVAGSGLSCGTQDLCCIMWDPLFSDLIPHPIHVGSLVTARGLQTAGVQ